MSEMNKEYDSSWYGSVFNNLKVSGTKFVKKPIYYFNIGNERAVVTEEQALDLAIHIIQHSKKQEIYDKIINKDGELE